MESKNSSDCVHCNALTPEQWAQLATPSYKLKKEKREAKKLETDTVHQDTESLVDPSAVSVIGLVEGSGTVKSPSLPPEKKPKKDKPKKAASSSTSTDGKIAELDLKWSERFNRLEALLLAKSFPQSFSSDVRVTPSHSPPPNVVKIRNLFSNQLQVVMLSALAQTFLLKNNCRLVSFCLRIRLLSALVQTLKTLKSSSRPVSYPQIFNLREVVLQGTLAQTLRLLQSTSRPVSYITQLQGALVQTSLFPDSSRPASLQPTYPAPTFLTDLDLLLSPALDLRLSTSQLDMTVSSVLSRLQRVCSPTSHQ